VRIRLLLVIGPPTRADPGALQTRPPARHDYPLTAARFNPFAGEGASHATPVASSHWRRCFQLPIDE
jgi:hypothetical protein